MNKSTPINQLPSQNVPQQNIFVNDQQRNMITQAQQAIGNSTLPQNTQLPSEVINEDDTAIQDMLNNLSSQQDTQSHQQQMPPVYSSQVQSPQEELMRFAAMNNLNINQLNSLMSGYGPPPFMRSMQDSPPPPPSFYKQSQQGYMKQLTHIFSSEMKLAGLVFLVVIVIQLLPLHKYIGRYIAVDRIPYHDVLLRAIVAALLIVITKKLVG